MPETIPQDNLPPELAALIFVVLIAILGYRAIARIVAEDHERITAIENESQEEKATS